MKKICPVCHGAVIGRSDKIYCSEQCRSITKYEKKITSQSFFVTVDKQLKTNRKLLKKYNLSGYTTLRKDVLLEKGFDPHFFTHYWKNQKGQIYLFCYDYGFLEIIKENTKKYLLVEWQDYMRRKR
ncbi:MAG: hypothetical protein K2X86_03955 [Cytophagaceae bacterium]|nr:hypothetical protein [Cytophagaceae bacterium]